MYVTVATHNEVMTKKEENSHLVKVNIEVRQQTQ